MKIQVADVEGIVERLLGFLDMGRACVTAEAIIHISDLLRRQPILADACISSVSNISPQVCPPPFPKQPFPAYSRPTLAIAAARSSACSTCLGPLPHWNLGRSPRLLTCITVHEPGL
jgi:hypothetical protein